MLPCTTHSHQNYVRSFRPVYEEEIKALFAESRASLGRVSDVKRPGGFLGRAGSNADMLTSIRASPFSGSVMVLSPTRDRGGGMAQSVADFSHSPGLSPGSDPVNRLRYPHTPSPRLTS